MEKQTEKDKIRYFFNTCASIEELCAELYYYYSDIFSEYEEASQLWKKTALEEENHKEQFVLAGRLIDDAVFEVNANLERSQRVYKKMQNLISHVHGSAPDIFTALTKAIEMEESLEDLHMESSVRFGNESIRKMFLAMRDFDREHIKSLKRFLTIMMLPKADMVG